ncbi:MAG: FAD-binding protein [Coriobacteriales bacterium]|nr:FAD-binding protein [Coriobacteriales bacterium]
MTKEIQDNVIASKTTKAEGLSRRRFMQGAVVLGAAAIAGTLAACDTEPSDQEPEKESEPEDVGDGTGIEWDRETEIVIVGYGGAGAVSAICATDAKAKLIVLEKQAKDVEGQPWTQTNNTRICYSAVMNFNSVAEARAYLKAVSRGRTPDDVIESWAKYAVSTVDFLQSLGGDPVDAGCTTEYPKDILPEAFDTYHQWAFRNQGPELWETLDKGCKSRDVEVLFETPGKQLLRNSDGVIIGVKAEQNGKDFYVKATKAVVLATAGFEYNEVMLQQFVWANPCRFYASPASTGDGVKMAQEVGADLWNMSLIGGRVIPYFPELGFGLMGGTPSPGILVNKYGKRFMRENWKSHSAVWESFKFSTDLGDFPAVPCFSVFDHSAYTRGPVISATGSMLKTGQYKWSDDNNAELAKGWILKGDTIEELASVIARDPDVGARMKPEVLAETLSTYNTNAAAGNDPEFGRYGNSLQTLDTPPYYALKMYPGGVNTFGGPKRNGKSQIVDVHGKAIPHLYGAGEMGSVLGFLYSGGGWNICEIITSGHIVAENAILETAWTDLA